MLGLLAKLFGGGNTASDWDKRNARWNNCADRTEVVLDAVRRGADRDAVIEECRRIRRDLKEV